MTIKSITSDNAVIPTAKQSDPTNKNADSVSVNYSDDQSLSQLSSKVVNLSRPKDCESE